MTCSKGTFHQYLATFASQLCTVASAVGFVWYTPLETWITSSKSAVSITSDELGWLEAVIELGEVLGPLPAGYVADRWGRKYGLLMSFPLMAGCWLVTALTRCQIGLYAARILIGVATGIIYTVGPIYIAEIAHPSIRGQLSVHMQTTWYLGVLYAYCTGIYLPYDYYIYASAIPTFLFIAVFVFMPETPFFLIMIGDERRAEKSLRWLRDGEVVAELSSIKATVSSELESKAGGWKDLFTSPQCRRPLFVMSVLCIVKYLGGVTTITNYATGTFERGGGVDPKLATIAMAIVLLVTTLWASYVADSVGRRPMILISTLGVALSSASIASYYLLENTYSLNKSYFWLLYLSFGLYCVFSNVGLGPIQTTLQAEYFPSHVRAPAGAYTTLLSNVFVYASIKLYQVLQDEVGLYSNYVLFSITCFIGVLILWPTMRETAQKSLGEIQNNNSCPD